MGAFLAIYVRVPVNVDLSVCLARYGEAFGEPNSEFRGIVLSPLQYDGSAPDDLEAVSAELNTDVLLLGFCGITNRFLFHHWRAGRRLRALEYLGMDTKYEWDLDEGEPEPWEPESFGALRAGRLVQDIEAHGAAELAAEFYRLPGWS